MVAFYSSFTYYSYVATGWKILYTIKIGTLIAIGLY